MTSGLSIPILVAQGDRRSGAVSEPAANPIRQVPIRVEVFMGQSGWSTTGRCCVFFLAYRWFSPKDAGIEHRIGRSSCRDQVHGGFHGARR